jgi:sugar lactone lactonase YvrE
MGDLSFAPVSEYVAGLGESPIWSAHDNSVWWVDITGQRLLKTGAGDGKTHSWATPEQIGFVVLTQTGRVLVGMETGLFWFEPGDGSFDLCAELGVENVRFNDATVDPAGRLWAGTMDIDNTRPVGVLYLVGEDLLLSPIIDGLMTVNGLAAEQGRLYISDSHPSVQTVWCAHLNDATGALGPRKVFARFQDLAGRPDGATIDAAGNYWIAGVGGAVVHVFAPDGTHIAQHPTPFADPTKPIFAGEDLRDVYLTSKFGKEPGAGSLSHARLSLGSKGRLISPFHVAV